MQALSSVPPTEPNPKAPDGPFIFRMVFESMKRSYEQRVALVTPSISSVASQGMPAAAGFQTPALTPAAKLHCPMNDRELLAYFEPISQDLNVAFGAPGDENTPPPSLMRNIPVYHDLWATMTMNWTDE